MSQGQAIIYKITLMNLSNSVGHEPDVGKSASYARKFGNETLVPAVHIELGSYWYGKML